MPAPLAPALVQAGSNVLSEVFGAITQGSANKASRKFALDMYNRTRADALSDWRMQNEYNSPSAQRERLKSAGLNANLVYGNGQAVTAADAPRGQTTPSWRPEAFKPDFGGIGQSLASVYDLELKSAQTDNLRSQNTVLLNDAILRASQVAETNARTAKTNLDTEAGKFSLGQAQRLADISADAAAAQLRKLQVDTDVTLDNNERQQALAQSSLATAAESILKSRSDRLSSAVSRSQMMQQIESIKRDVTLKDLDIQLRRMGVQPNDPLWSRIVGRIVSNPEKIKEIARKALQEAKKFAHPYLMDPKK